MLPIVSTMLMPSRLAEGDVPLWQLVVAIVTTVVAAVLLVRVGGPDLRADAAAHRPQDRFGRRCGRAEADCAETRRPGKP